MIVFINDYTQNLPYYSMNSIFLDEPNGKLLIRSRLLDSSVVDSQTESDQAVPLF